MTRWITAMDAHSGAATWLAGFATLAAVIAALLVPIATNFWKNHQRRSLFLTYNGHAHALVRMYFNTNDRASENATVVTRAVEVALQSALQATEDAIKLRLADNDLMIGALNMRTSLNFMILDLERTADGKLNASVKTLRENYLPMRPDIERWREKLKALGADVGSDDIDSNDPHIVKT